MAFTPEDVLNKHFTATQFRRGYDEQEVDDFLDEIVVELRRLTSDNDDLGVQLKACQENKSVAVPRGAMVSAAVAGAGSRAESTIASEKNGRAPERAAISRDEQLALSEAAVAATAVAERIARDKIAAAKGSAEQAEKDATARISKAKTDAELAEAQAVERVKAAKQAKEAADKAAKEAKEAADQAVQDAKEAADKTIKEAAAAAEKSAKSSSAAPAPAPAVVAPPVTAPVISKEQENSTAAGVLALAQKLHEEYVSEGQDTRQRLISEGQAHHDKVVGEATAKHAELLSTGQAKHDEFLAIGRSKHSELLSTGQAKHDSLIAEASARHEQMITEARERSTGMLAEAQQKKAAVLDALARERDMLEKKIDELRTFERDYRARLKSYLEGQLQELDHVGADGANDGEGEGKDGQQNG
jgi:DivIVA domain-containing protein